MRDIEAEKQDFSVRPGEGMLPDLYPPRDVRFNLAIVSICLVCLASTIDLVILASALPAVSRTMDATSTEMYWCGTALLLSQALAQPIYCALQNIFGHKQCMVVAIAIFGVSSVLCATAGNMTWLIAARVLQGVGIGGCNVMVNVLIVDMTPLSVRGKYLGITQLTAAIGLVAGIVMGAAFSTLSTWRLIFWINLPICAVSGAGILFFVKPSISIKDNGESRINGLKALDISGVVILTGSLLGLLYGVTAGGTLYPWNSARIIVSLFIGAFGFVAFTLYELNVAKYPMIRMRLFRDRTVASGLFAAWAHGVIDIALAYYLILYFLIGRLHPLLRSSLEITPGLASIPFWAALTGFGMAHTSRFKAFNVVAWIFVAAGVGSLASLTPQSHLWAAYGSQLVLAVGSGALYPGRLLAVQAPLQQRQLRLSTGASVSASDGGDVSVATALVSVFTSIGNAFGVGLGGTILQNEWDKLVSSAPANYHIPSDALESSLEVINQNQWPSGIVAYYQEVFCGSIKVVWIFAAALGGLGLITTLFQRDVRLRDR